jgi:uncharacterized protein YrrD
MPVSIGTEVRSSDGQGVGVIKFMVLDSFNARVRSVVVERGHLIRHDVEIPIGYLRFIEPDMAQTTYTRDEVFALPEFDETGYAAPESVMDAYGETHTEPAVWPVMPPGLASPTAYGAMNYPLITEPLPNAGEMEAMEAARIRARENAVVKPGADVITRGGTKVGELHGATIDLNSERLIEITVKSGYFHVEETAILGGAVESAETGTLYLNLEAESLQGAVHEEVRALV